MTGAAKPLSADNQGEVLVHTAGGEGIHDPAVNNHIDLTVTGFTVKVGHEWIGYSLTGGP